MNSETSNFDPAIDPVDEDSEYPDINEQDGQNN
jgi:hypothetical protein